MRFHIFRAEARELLAPTIEVVEGRLGAIYRRPEGAPVVSLADGQVRSVRDDEGAGRSIEIAHADGSVARYSHLMRPFGQLTEGDAVTQGQLIGLAGHSGTTATDRVRLELSPADEAGPMLDPLLPTASGEARPSRIGESLAGAALSRFQGAIRPWRKSLLRDG
jgi:murein DD-endopeptidase MepM/ murein hydrolase activator NlpD